MTTRDAVRAACVCEVLSPDCATQQPLTVVKSGYISSPLGSTDATTTVDADDADRCSTLVLETLPWKSVRISLVGLYSRSQLFGYCTEIRTSSSFCSWI